MSSTKTLILFLSTAMILIGFSSLTAQTLPTGKFNRNRERTIDILHYKADLSFDYKEKRIAGKATIVSRPLTRITTFSLDAVRLKIDAIQLIQNTNSQSLQYNYLDKNLSIHLDKTYSANDTLEIVIEYSAVPNAGMYFWEDKSRKGQYFIHTDDAGNGLHANWLPIYNDVNDKFSWEVIATVPAPYSVISNGKLLGLESLSDNLRRFHWKQELPHSSYLIAVYAGEFERGSLSSAFGRIPINYWVPKGRLAEGENVFGNTPEMVEFFSKLFKYKYPWDKYDQVVVPDYGHSAMENTSVTLLRDSILRDKNATSDKAPQFDSYSSAFVFSAENIVAHELAHQWFGDNLTCRSQNHIWLNESFATYCHMLWDEERYGTDNLLLDRQLNLDAYLKYVDETHNIRPLEYQYYDIPHEMSNKEHTYIKGAIVLHMLRNILGDDDFFAALSYFLHKHEFSNVESSDFKIAIEEATGKNLDWFFEDWIYGGGHPIFEVNTSYLKNHKVIDLTVKQVQPIVEGQNLFKLPVEIAIKTSTGSKIETIWVENKTERFFIECGQKPLMVSFDGRGALVAEIHFKKPIDELIYQIKNGQLTGRMRALRQLAGRFPVNPKSIQVISEIVSGKYYWGLQAEAVLLLAKLRTSEAEALLTRALELPDYRIRKAAVLALRSFKIVFAEQTLKNIIEKDSHLDVCATAIVALGKVNPAENIDFISKQIGRTSWYDEITLACLKAFSTIGDQSLVTQIKPFTNKNNNRIVRAAALQAWKDCAPEDKNLHTVLLENVESTQHPVQLLSIRLLGSLYLEKALPTLERVVKTSGHPSVRAAASNAISRIKRILYSENLQEVGT